MTLTIVWVIIWLLNNTPDVKFDPMNAWGTWLIICLAIDLLTD